MIRKTIEKHIHHLELEQIGMIRNLAFYPPGSFGELRLNLAIKVSALKITIWQSFLPKNKIEINGMIFQVGKTYKLKFVLNEETQLIGKAKVISINDDTVHWKGVGNLQAASGGFKKGKGD